MSFLLTCCIMFSRKKANCVMLASEFWEPQAFFDFDRTAERTLAPSLQLVPTCQLYDQQYDLAAAETTEVLVDHRPVSVRSRTLNFVAHSVFLSACFSPSTPLSIRHCLPVSVCLSLHLSKKRIHPRLSGFDLQANLFPSYNRCVPVGPLCVTPAWNC